MKTVISVCGSDGDDERLSSYAIETAEKVGRLIAESGAVVVCGGHSGIMEAVCKGAKDCGGVTVAILPESNKDFANQFVDVGIPTGLGFIRNYLVSNVGDAVIAINGRWGTLNEISYAMITEKPLILIKGTGGVVDEIVAGNIMQNVESVYHVVDSADEAVEKALSISSKS